MKRSGINPYSSSSERRSDADNVKSQTGWYVTCISGLASGAATTGVVSVALVLAMSPAQDVESGRVLDFSRALWALLRVNVPFGVCAACIFLFFYEKTKTVSWLMLLGLLINGVVGLRIAYMAIAL